MRGRERGCMHKVAWQRVFVGIRHTTTLCYLCVCSNQRKKKGGCAVRAVVRVVLHCTGRHPFCPLSLPFASYLSGRAGGGWARLAYASWSPFAFVGVVAVLITCSLRSVAWHVTYLDPTSHVCTLCMFSFCLCAFFCVVLHLGGVWPPSLVLLSLVGFLFPRRVPSYHFARQWR